MDSVAAVVSFLTQVIQNAPTKSVRASQLAVLMRGMHPDFVLFKHGFRSFADFVAKSAPDLAVVQRSGGDLVYGIRSEWADRQPAANEATGSRPHARLDQGPTFNVRVLRTFASPNAPYKIFGNTNSGFLLVRPTRAGPMPEPWVEVPVCTASDHLQIAREFISSLPDNALASSLQVALSKPRWWDSFSWVARQAGVDKEWHEFRQRRLRLKLQDALGRVHVPITGPPPDQANPITENIPRAAVICEPSTVLLRRLAIAAIQKMTTEELRSLRLPLGYLVDELETAE